MRRAAIVSAALGTVMFTGTACGVNGEPTGPQVPYRTNVPKQGGAPTMECLPNINCSGKNDSNDSDTGNSGSGSSSGGKDCGYSFNPCAGGGNGGPIASADAQPLNMPECQLDYYIPVEINDGSEVQGLFVIRCVRKPAVILATAKLQFKNSAGNWVDESNIYVTTAPPEPNIPQIHQLPNVACYPGEWRLEGHWNGIKSDGKTPFPNPADGDTPNDWASATVRLSCG